MSATVGLGVAITLADMFTPKLKNAEKGVGRFAAKLAALSTASVAIGQKMSASFSSAYETFGDVAEKQGDLMSVSVGFDQMMGMEKGFIDFSNRWSGITTKGLYAASYSIKSGLSHLTKDGIEEMTKDAALTAKATKSNTSQMTALWATGYGIYRKQFTSFAKATIKGWDELTEEEKDLKFSKYFSAGIASSVQGFKTDGANMSAAISNLGAAGTKAKVGFAEQLSVLGQLQTTMSGSEAATKYRSFLNTIAKAGKDLKLNFLDSNKQLLSMPKILKELKKKYGSSLDAMEKMDLKKALGTDEAMATVLLLWDSIDELEGNIKKTDQALKGGTAITTQMAEAREYGQESKLLGDQLQNLAYIFGKSLAPSMGWVTKKFSVLVGWVQDFVGNHKQLATTVASGLVVFAGLATTLGTLGVAVAGISFGLSTLGLSMSGLLVYSAPIMGLVAGIAYAGYYIYEHWEKVSSVVTPFFKGLWLGLSESSKHFDRLIEHLRPVGHMFSWIVGKGGEFLSWIGAIDNATSKGSDSFYSLVASGDQLGWKISSVFGTLVDIIGLSVQGWVKIFDWGWAGIEAVVSWNPMETIKSAWSGVVSWFESMFKRIMGFVDKIKGLAESVKSFVTGSSTGADARIMDSRNGRVGPALKTYDPKTSLAAKIHGMSTSPAVNKAQQITNVREGDTHIEVNVHGKNDSEIVRQVTSAIKKEIQDKQDRSMR